MDTNHDDDINQLLALLDRNLAKIYSKNDVTEAQKAYSNYKFLEVISEDFVRYHQAMSLFDKEIFLETKDNAEDLPSRKKIS